MLTLSKEECEAIYELIDQLSGGNPENAFGWDGKDDLSDPTTRACAKLFLTIDREVPDSCAGALNV